MGLSVIGALLFLTLSLIAQSPGLQKRVGLSGARLDLRVRTFTSFAFALLLLAIGFFLAGVPLNSGTSTATANQTPQATASPSASLTPAIVEDTSSNRNKRLFRRLRLAALSADRRPLLHRRPAKHQQLRLQKSRQSRYPLLTKAHYHRPHPQHPLQPPLSPQLRLPQPAPHRLLLHQRLPLRQRQLPAGPQSSLLAAAMFGCTEALAGKTWYWSAMAIG